MVRGTTPTIKISINNYDITKISKWFVTFAQGGKQITKKDDDITFEDGYMYITFTQKETLSFMNSVVEVQINAITNDGQRLASNIVADSFERNLYNEVIEV